MGALRRWRDAQRSQVDTFVPHPFRTLGAGAIEQEYAENKARIEQEMAEAKAKANADKADEKKDDSTNDAPKADTDDKDTPAASAPSVDAAAIIGSSSYPLVACFALVASAASMAFVVSRPRASHQHALSEGLLAPGAPLAHADVV